MGRKPTSTKKKIYPSPSMQEFLLKTVVIMENDQGDKLYVFSLVNEEDKPFIEDFCTVNQARPVYFKQEDIKLSEITLRLSLEGVTDAESYQYKGFLLQKEDLRTRLMLMEAYRVNRGYDIRITDRLCCINL